MERSCRVVSFFRSSSVETSFIFSWRDLGWCRVEPVETLLLTDLLLEVVLLGTDAEVERLGGLSTSSTCRSLDLPLPSFAITDVVVFSDIRGRG